MHDTVPLVDVRARVTTLVNFSVLFVEQNCNGVFLEADVMFLILANFVQRSKKQKALRHGNLNKLEWT